MLKNVLVLNGVEKLSRNQQSGIFGGVDKCCLKIPTHGFTQEDDGECSGGQRPCNTHPGCTHAHCSCNNSGPCW